MWLYVKIWMGLIRFGSSLIVFTAAAETKMVDVEYFFSLFVPLIQQPGA